MTIKQQLAEANKDKEHLSKMCEKLVYENIRLNKQIKTLIKHFANKEKQ